MPVVLDSRSTDLRANFGGIEGRALRNGDVIPLSKWPGSSAFATSYGGQADPGYSDFLVDRTTRLGESDETIAGFAFHPRCAL